MTGLFVTFEGLDGSGKSTHLERVARRLEAAGVPHRVTHEPGGTPLGEALREIFLDKRWGAVDGVTELLLVFASRRQHLVEVIEPALARGEHVLSDRFTDSTHAYQGAGRGVAPELIAEIERLATAGRQPDLTLLFDLPVEVAARRREGSAAHDDRLDVERLEFHQRVRAGFLELADAQPARIRTIDSSGPREATAAQVDRALAPLFDGEAG